MWFSHGMVNFPPDWPQETFVFFPQGETDGSGNVLDLIPGFSRIRNVIFSELPHQLYVVVVIHKIVVAFWDHFPFFHEWTRLSWNLIQRHFRWCSGPGPEVRVLSAKFQLLRKINEIISLGVYYLPSSFANTPGHTLTRENQLQMALVSLTSKIDVTDGWNTEWEVIHTRQNWARIGREYPQAVRCGVMTIPACFCITGSLSKAHNNPYLVRN